MLPALLALLLVATPCAPVASCVAEAATADLTARFPADAHRVEVRVRRLSPSLEGTAPADAVRLRWPALNGLPSGTLQVTVESAPRGWALLEIARFDSVVVAGDDLARDQRVDPAALTVAWLETTRFHGTPLTVTALQRLGADDLVATRLLQAGRVLRIDDLRRPAAATTGDPVTMTYAADTFELALACTARATGEVGEAIRVYCAATDRTYRARLTAPGEAAWLETL